MAMRDGVSHQVTLRWDAPSQTGGAAVRYKIEVSVNGDAPRMLVEIAGTVYTDTDTYSDGANVKYTVTAVNDAGPNTEMPPVASVNIPTPPIPMQTCTGGQTIPTSQTCPVPMRECTDGSTIPESQMCPVPMQTCAGGGMIPAGEVCPDPIGQVAGFTRMPVERSFVTLGWDAPQDVGSQTVTYRVEYSGDDGASYQVLADAHADVTFRHVTPLSLDGPARFQYRITPITRAGDGAAFESLSIFNPRPKRFCSNGLVLPVRGNCMGGDTSGAVRGLAVARDQRTDNITLTWQPPHANLPARYRFEVSVDGGAFAPLAGEVFGYLENELTFVHRNAPSGNLKYRVTPTRIYGEQAADQPGRPALSTEFLSIPDAAIPAAGTGTPDSFFTPDCNPLTEDCFFEVECLDDPRINPIHAECTGTGDSSNRDISLLSHRVYPAGLTSAFRLVWGNETHPQLRVLYPPQDVRAAWRLGWNGAGINMLVVDYFGGPGDNSKHGHAVSAVALEIAPRVKLFPMQVWSGLRKYRETYSTPGAETFIARDQKFEVINLSIAAYPFDQPATPAQLSSFLGRHFLTALFNDLTGGEFGGPAGELSNVKYGAVYLTNTADAVLVKGASNEPHGSDATRDVFNLALVTVPETADRALIVGGLTHYARPSLVGENDNVGTNVESTHRTFFAGLNSRIQERFVVEYAGPPFVAGAVFCDAGSTTATGCLNPDESFFESLGTSYATPRVSGYAALLRQKFPNLSGAQTTKILLDTATYENLTCDEVANPNCWREEFGQGRVDIGSALSPIGKLK